MLALAALVALAGPAEGRPLFYWGARSPVVAAEPAPQPGALQPLEVHAVFDRGDLVVRFTFDAAVRTGLLSPDGAPVSGRLSAVLYLDVDDDRGTGQDRGPRDSRTGAERRLELGTVALGADPEEQRDARALVSATLFALTPEGRRRTLWRADDEAEPGRVSVHDDSVELRVPEDRLGTGAGRCRLVLAVGDRTFEGRLGR